MDTHSEGIRVNLYIARCGVCSRREADRLIGSGRVSINGIPADSGQKVFAGDKVTLDGKVLFLQNQQTVYALYKPCGYVCTTDRRWGDPLIGDLIPGEGRLFPVGRLDKNSEGLILMTNDGSLADNIMRSRNRHEKEYLVTVDRDFDDQFLKNLSGGVYLAELQTTTRPCRVSRTGAGSFRIILTQGLNRQIRRMCNAFGFQVILLRRIRIMGITLGEMQPGEYRKLTQEEISLLSQTG